MKIIIIILILAATLAFPKFSFAQAGETPDSFAVSDCQNPLEQEALTCSFLYIKNRIYQYSESNPVTKVAVGASPFILTGVVKGLYEGPNGPRNSLT